MVDSLAPMAERYQCVRLQCADCTAQFSLFLLLRRGARPTVKPSSNVRQVGGKFVHLCGGPLKLLEI